MYSISVYLYIIFYKYAIETVGIFVWAYTVVQWSCMTRSISIDDLAFGQIVLGKDSLVIEYYDSKSDKKGEHTSPKNAIVIHLIV